MKKESQQWLDSLDKQDLLAIIKYGLRSAEVQDGVCVPSDVTVEDIYIVIGCNYIKEQQGYEGRREKCEADNIRRI